MFNEVKKEIEWGGRTLKFETGKIARQADGAVMVTYGETVVLCTVVGKKDVNPDQDFFPLTVHYQEKTYSAGKIPGGFFKREGRPSEKETLTSRLIDRPIRPLFPEGFLNDTQIVCQLVSHDLQNDSDIVALIGASAALTISGMPFLGPIAGAKVGYKDGNYILNPTFEQIENSDLELVVAGTDSSVLMVESEANELTEEVMLGAVKFGHEQFQPVIKAIIELAEKCAKDPWEIAEKSVDEAFEKQVKDLAEGGLRKAYKIQDKQERTNAISEVKSATKEKLIEAEYEEGKISASLKDLEKHIVRGDLIKDKTRIDGRKPSDVRQIETQVGLLPRTHGSALFTRGETQALVVATLGTGEDQQLIDAIEGSYKANFMLHYNFPPYSVGEASPMRPPGRREIGHGKLAFRGVKAMLPGEEEFPYTIRVVSEITESNGSSSMASVCGTSLALMDAGVPFKKPVAGIAMGLVKEGDDFVVLSDIMGDEDHLGDMDFKVAGTKDGINALQMDIKINGITFEIMETALAQAKDGRNHILGEMAKSISEPRGDVNSKAPRFTTLKISKDKIGELIGPGGKNIREICEVANAKVDIDEEGLVKVATTNGEDAKIATDMINALVLEPEVGEIYTGKVDKIVEFGAFVKFFGKASGLLHISEIAHERVKKVEDYLSEGDEVEVKLLGVDRGKFKLSRKALLDKEDDKESA